MSEQEETTRYDNLKPGDLISFQIVGRIETVSESGYVVFTHGVAGIPILKSSVKEVFRPEEKHCETCGKGESVGDLDSCHICHLFFCEVGCFASHMAFFRRGGQP